MSIFIFNEYTHYIQNTMNILNTLYYLEMKLIENIV